MREVVDMRDSWSQVVSFAGGCPVSVALLDEIGTTFSASMIGNDTVLTAPLQLPSGVMEALTVRRGNVFVRGIQHYDWFDANLVLTRFDVLGGRL